MHEKHISSREFGSLIGRTTNTLQRWDRQGILKAHRNPTRRRYYTHDQYLEVTGHKSSKKRLVIYCRVSSAGQKKDLLSQRNPVESFIQVFRAGYMVLGNTRRKSWK